MPSCRQLDNYRVDRRTGCWLFLGSLHHRDGYGMLRCGGRMMQAHRVSYEARVGPIPAGLVIDHVCGNRACVNPEHLEPVTVTENNRRGRGTKLDPERVREIRRLAEHGAAIREMARLYGVSPITVKLVVERRTWTDV